MSEKKRKSAPKEVERPSKKQQTASTVQVKHLSGPDIAKPVIAYSPGVAFPNVTFQSFAKSAGGKSDLLLRSTDHSTLNHTARGDDSSAENYLKHYVAIFDPETGKLQVTEAKRMTVRSSLRTAGSSGDNQEEDENSAAPVSNSTSRTALTAAFGTKKSKKAVQSMTENRLLAQGTEGTDNPVSTAMMSKLAENEDFGNEVSLNDALRNKPLPPADLGTNELDQVYSLNTLVQPSPADATLATMPIKTWMARISAKKDVKTRSRFAASRIGYLVNHLSKTPETSNPKAVTALQVLRYIQLLLDIHTYITRLPSNRKPIPHFDTWPDTSMSDGTPMNLVRPILSHFFPDRIPKSHAVTLLRTTILALTLHMPPPSLNTGKFGLISDTTEISMDMAIDGAEIRKLYHELGCRIAPAKDTELLTWGLERLGKKQKDAAGKPVPKPTFARLSFPLDFPKVSRGRAVGRK